MNLLLCLLIAVSPVKATRQADTLTISLPKLPIVEHYGKPIWCPQASRSEWLSPNSVRIWTEETTGTVEVLACGIGYCRLVEVDWEAPPHQYPPWPKTLFWIMAGIACAVLLIVLSNLVVSTWIG